MRRYWRRHETPLDSHADWLAKLDPKNRKQGTSAPTLAAIWAGPVEVLGALRGVASLADMSLDEILVEAQSTFDEYPGGRRNHDLVVHGHLPDGGRVVVCVEAKAGETLGKTVEQFRVAAASKRDKGESTNAPERLDDLLTRYAPGAGSEGRLNGVRYQLLTALAGTEAEATRANAQHAVLMLHEFVTDQRSKGEAIENGQALHDFCEVVLGLDSSREEKGPWCREVVPAPSGMTSRLYVAHAVTDLRTVTLEGPSSSPTT